MGMANTFNLLSRAARVYGSHPAVYHGVEKFLNFTDLAFRSTKVAHALQTKYRLNPRDRVALFMPNRPEYLELLFGSWLSSMSVVPVNAKLHHEELGYILRHSEARILFTSEESYDDCIAAFGSARKRDIIPVDSNIYRGIMESGAQSVTSCENTADDDLAWLFYTSGTTGRPKGAQITHNNLRAMCYSYFSDVDQVRVETMDMG